MTSVTSPVPFQELWAKPLKMTLATWLAVMAPKNLMRLKAGEASPGPVFLGLKWVLCLVFSESMMFAVNDLYVYIMILYRY